MGISAGSMNSSDIVYAQPELDGEVIDHNYKKFFKGLNLTKIRFYIIIMLLKMKN